MTLAPVETVLTPLDEIVLDSLGSAFDDGVSHGFCTDCFDKIRALDVLTAACGKKIIADETFHLTEVMPDDEVCSVCLDALLCPVCGGVL